MDQINAQVLEGTHYKYSDSGHIECTTVTIKISSKRQ